MAKLSDLWYHPINPKIIEELMVSLDIGKGKDYTVESVIDSKTNNIVNFKRK